MKRIILFILPIVLLACVKPEPTVINPEEESVVIVNCSPAKAPLATEDITLLAANITRLDIFITNASTGEIVSEAHEVATSTSDASFGSNISFTGLRKGTNYIVYALGHKNDNAVVFENNVMSFSDGKIKASYFCKNTFTPTRTVTSNVNTLNLTLNPIVGKFKIATTDAFPNNVSRVRITVEDTYMGWNAVDLVGVNQEDRVINYENISLANDGTCSFIVYIIALNQTDETLVDITFEALDSNNELIDAITLEDVRIKDGYTTLYSGQVFNNTQASTTFSITCTWNELISVEF